MSSPEMHAPFPAVESPFMTARKAQRLRKNDHVGIVSPSAPVTAAVKAQLENGLRTLRDIGLEPVLAPNALSNSLGYSATAEEKAADINQMFADDSIRAIICSQGGASGNTCFPLLDWEMIRRNPKIFLGISDITPLLNAIQAKTGLVTFHGNDVIWGLGRQPTAYDLEELEDRLMNGRIGPISRRGPRITVRGGAVEGKLLGGNVFSLQKLIGTEYLPDFRDSILFIESFGFVPDTTQAMFCHLEQAGIFDELRGVVVGHIHDDEADKKTVTLEQVLLTVVEKYDFPILKMEEFGHNCPNTVIPVGARARLDAEAQELTIIEGCVA
jgi:muramoyltetrapeptide carboxypeptidase